MRGVGLAALLLIAGCGPVSSVSATTPRPSASVSAVSPWSTLRQRAVQLPALAAGDPCPESRIGSPDPAFGLALGAGPVYAVTGGGVIGAMTLNKILWIAAPSYAGPLLIRGSRLDAAGVVDLEATGAVLGSLRIIKRVETSGPITPLYAELDLPAQTDTVTASPAWRSWPSYTYVDASGCYAWQVDGVNVHEVIPFSALEN